VAVTDYLEWSWFARASDMMDYTSLLVLQKIHLQTLGHNIEDVIETIGGRSVQAASAAVGMPSSVAEKANNY